MIPSYFKIEILAIQDKFVLSGRKGLRRRWPSRMHRHPFGCRHLVFEYFMGRHLVFECFMVQVHASTCDGVPPPVTTRGMAAQRKDCSNGEAGQSGGEEDDAPLNARTAPHAARKAPSVSEGGGGGTKRKLAEQSGSQDVYDCIDEDPEQPK